MGKEVSYNFIATATQIKKFDDGSGETAIWTDGLSVSTLDHRSDNLTPIKLISGQDYEVTIILSKRKKGEV